MNKINRSKLINLVAQQLYPESQTILKKPLLVLLTGYTRAGKTTLVETDGLLNRCFVIRNDDIREEVYKLLPKSDGINRAFSKERKLLDAMVKECRELLLRRGLDQGWALVVDACNLFTEERTSIIYQAADNGYKTKIIWVNTPKHIIRKRLLRADNTYQSLSTRIRYRAFAFQQLNFQPPAPNEADELVIYS